MAAKATADSIVFMPGMNPRPPARMSFSAACEVEPCNKTCNRNVIRFSTQTRAQMAESTDTKPAIELLLIRLQIDNGFEDVIGLGEDGVFEDGLVGDEGVHGADAADGGV